MAKDPDKSKVRKVQNAPGRVVLWIPYIFQVVMVISNITLWWVLLQLWVQFTYLRNVVSLIAQHYIDM